MVESRGIFGEWMDGQEDELIRAKPGLRNCFAQSKKGWKITKIGPA
jgi:hypothetical protein